LVLLEAEISVSYKAMIYTEEREREMRAVETAIYAYLDPHGPL